MRDRITDAMKSAMKSGDRVKLATTRLMLAALKDRELGVGGQPPTGPLGEAEIVQVLTKMVKQRRDSIATYEQAGRKDLAEQEAAEIKVIEEFLPRQMSVDEAAAAVAAVVAEVGAKSPKDMGKVMGALKQRYAGRMDFAQASAVLKTLLN
jgi:hypothetical protein